MYGKCSYPYIHIGYTYIVQCTISMQGMLMLGDLGACSQEKFGNRYSEIDFGGISGLNYSYSHNTLPIGCHYNYSQCLASVDSYNIISTTQLAIWVYAMLTAWLQQQKFDNSQLAIALYTQLALLIQLYMQIVNYSYVYSPNNQLFSQLHSQLASYVVKQLRIVSYCVQLCRRLATQ